MSHARFSPSSAFRWMNCTKSLTLPPKPETTNKYAIRGTALHAMSDDILKDNPIQLSYEGYAPTSDDIEDVVKPYVEYVKNIDATHSFFEQKVFLSEDCYGTVDALLYDDKSKTLHVIDLKCGSQKVEPLDNKQLNIYAIGAVNFLREKMIRTEKIFVHIFQPFLNKQEPVEVFKSDLKVLRKEVLQVVDDVKEDKTVFVASEPNCKWCPHITDCPEVLKMANKVAREDFSKTDTLSEQYEKALILQKYVDAVKSKTYIALDTGEKVAGFCLKQTQNRRHWKNEGEITNLLTQNNINHEEFIDTKILSVAKIEKILKSKKIKLELSEFIYIKKTKPSIAKI